MAEEGRSFFVKTGYGWSPDANPVCPSLLLTCERTEIQLRNGCDPRQALFTLAGPDTGNISAVSNESGGCDDVTTGLCQFLVNIGPVSINHFQTLGPFTFPELEICDKVVIEGRVVFAGQVNPSPTVTTTPGIDPTPSCPKDPDSLVKGEGLCEVKVDLFRSGQPVKDENGVAMTVKTDPSGFFRFEYVAAPGENQGTFQLLADKPGFCPVSKSLVVNPCTPEKAFTLLEMLLGCESCPITGSNPINPLTGEGMLSVTELAIPGRGGLDFSFERIHRSYQAQADGPFGFGWTHNWDIRLRESGDGNWILRWKDGKDHLMVPDPAHPGGFKGVQGLFLTMHFENNCWELEETDGTLWHFIAKNVQYYLNFVLDRHGNRISLDYSGDSLSTLTDSGGRSFSLNYGPGGRISTFSAPNAGQGGLWTYTYTPSGELDTVSGPGSGPGPQPSYFADYDYDLGHRLVAKTDPKGGKGLRRLTYQYDSAGRVSGEFRPNGGSAVMVNYGVNETKDLIYTINDAFTTRQFIDDFGRPSGKSAGNALSLDRTKLSYNAFAQGVTLSVDVRGFSTLTQYKPGNRGELDFILDPAGLRSSYQYGPHGVVTERRDKDTATNEERVYTASVDPQGRIQSSSDNGRVTTYTYQGASGDWTQMTDDDGGITRRTFDPVTGLLSSTLNVRDGLETAYTYDAWGRLKTVLNKRSNLLSTHTYDGAGNIIRTDFSGDGGSSFTEAGYDSDGKLMSRTDEKGKTTTFEYTTDGKDNLLREIGPDGSYVKEFGYDFNSQVNLETLSGPDGNGGTYSQTTRYFYVPSSCGCTNQGKLSEVRVEGAKGCATCTAETLVTTYEYDPDGNRTDIKVLDGNGAIQNRTHMTYDGNNRMTSVTTGYLTADFRTVTYAYNAFGERRTLTDGKNQTTQFHFNGHGELEEEDPAQGPSLNYGYSDAGKLNEKTDRNSKVWSATHDDRGRLLSETFKDENNATQTHAYQFGAGTDQLTSVNDPTGAISFSYGHRGRLESQTMHALQRRLSMDYDNAGNMLQLNLENLSNGTSKSSTNLYDSLNRVTDYTDLNGNRFKYHYDAAGQLRIVEYKRPDNSRIATARMDYDSAGRMMKAEYRKGSSPGGTVLAQVSYTYDSAGNRTSRKTMGSQASYGYNNLNELTSDANSADQVRSDTGAQAFSYDQAGNRTAQTFEGHPAINYNISNQLNRLDAYDGVTFEQDQEGNRIKRTDADSETRYFWDGKQRLTKALLPDGTEIRYGYDYNNHRVSRTVSKTGQPTETRTYLYYGNQVIEETLNGQRLALYGWDQQGLISRTDQDGHSLFYLWDGLGSALALIDEKGNIVQSYEYSGFGEVLSGKDAVNAFRFVGRYSGQQDDLSGLTYFWNRWYDPQVGRWLSEDPIRWESKDKNFSGYALNRPTILRDTNGLDAWAVLGATASIHIGIPGASAGILTYTNVSTAEVCAVAIFCPRLGVGLYFGAGAVAGMLWSGPQCGKNLGGTSTGVAIEFGAPGAGGGGGAIGVGDDGEGGKSVETTVSIRPGISAGGVIALESCQGKLLGCTNTPNCCPTCK